VSNVDAAMPLDDLLKQVIYFCRLTHIRADKACVPAGLSNEVDSLLCTHSVDVRDNDGCTRIGASKGAGTSNAGRSSCYEGNLTRKTFRLVQIQLLRH
jgi:hypothetical protein